MLNNDLFDRLSDFDDLSSTGPGMSIETSAFRPSIGIVMMTDVSEQRIPVPFVDHDPDVLVDPGRPKPGITTAVYAMQRMPRTIGVLLDVERRDFRLRLLLTSELLERLGEAGSNENGQETHPADSGKRVPSM